LEFLFIVKINKVTIYISNHIITLISKLFSSIPFIPGNIDSHSLYGSGSIDCSTSNCRQHTTIIAGSIVGGGIGMILVIVGIVLYYSRCKGRPSQTNLKFVNSTNHNTSKCDLYDTTLFKSGIWSSRYLQFGLWHDFHLSVLLFDPQSFKITGSGSDNIGMFTIDGTYSPKTRRIGMIKAYQLGTGNRLDKFDYQMIIQLIWNSETRQFEGKWYVQTKKYRGENKFELRFSKQQQPCTYQEV
jgi:hypothetical protein